MADNGSVNIRDRDRFYGARQSGRTSRLAREAAQALRVGRKVAVVCAYQVDCQRIKEVIREKLEDELKRDGDQLAGMHAQDRVNDATYLRLESLAGVDMLRLVQRPELSPVRGWPLNSLTLVDHYAVQTYMELFAPLLRRWDARG